MIKMVAPSMASRVIDRAIQVSTDDGSLVLLNHSQDSKFLSFSCPTSCKLTAALCCTPPIMTVLFLPRYNPMRGPIPASILNTWKQKHSKVICPRSLSLQGAELRFWGT